MPKRRSKEKSIQSESSWSISLATEKRRKSSSEGEERWNTKMEEVELTIEK